MGWEQGWYRGLSERYEGAWTTDTFLGGGGGGGREEGGEGDGGGLLESFRYSEGQSWWFLRDNGEPF